MVLGGDDENVELEDFVVMPGHDVLRSKTPAVEGLNNMPANYTSATARVVLCVDHEAPDERGPLLPDARVINLPFWSTLMLEFDAF